MDVSTAWLCSTLCPFSKAFWLHEAPPSPAARSGAWAHLIQHPAALSAHGEEA